MGTCLVALSLSDVLFLCVCGWGNSDSWRVLGGASRGWRAEDVGLRVKGGGWRRPEVRAFSKPWSSQLKRILPELSRIIASSSLIKKKKGVDQDQSICLPPSLKPVN